jgi:hypothetical protein
MTLDHKSNNIVRILKKEIEQGFIFVNLLSEIMLGARKRVERGAS